MFDPFTLIGFHTWLSLIALASGAVLLAGLIGARDPKIWTAIFLATAIGTSVTGFIIPFSGILPSHVVGALSLAVLALALVARYRFGLRGRWRLAWVLGLVAAEYLLAFVGVAQAFQKVPALHAVTPTGAEAPFALAQGALLVLFVLLGVLAARAGRPLAIMPRAAA